jgi:hypothetical protein
MDSEYYEQNVDKVIDPKLIDFYEYTYLKNFKMSLVNIQRLEEYFIKFPLLKKLVKKSFKYVNVNNVIKKAIKAFKYTDEQQNVIKEVIKFIANKEQKFFGVFGSAGTGKTTIIIKLIYFLIQNNLINKAGVFAPTHKALNILKVKFTESSTEKIDDYEEQKLSFLTIHQLLNFVPEVTMEGTLDFVKIKRSKIIKEYEVIIFDECSMIAKNLINIIFSEVVSLNKIKIIFCGDPSQLPPVHEKKGIIFDKIDNKIVLNKAVRCQNEFMISLWDEIRNWTDTPKLKQFVGKLNIFFYNNRKKFSDKCVDNMKNNKCDIVLAWTNNCVDEYNRIIREVLVTDIKKKFAEGDIIIVNNFYEMKGEFVDKKLYTSEQIKVVNAEEIEKKVVEFKIQEKILKNKIPRFKDECKLIENIINKKTTRNYRCWKLLVKNYNMNTKEDNNIYIVYVCDDSKLDIDKQKTLRIIQKFKFKHSKEIEIIKYMLKEFYNLFVEPFADVNYGYAITCHKSQGSTYHNVFVDVEDISKNIDFEETKRCLYTAITRTSNEIHLLF